MFHSLFKKAVIFQQNGDESAAIKLYQQLIEEQNDLYSFINLTALLRHNGHTDKAHKLCLHALHHHPEIHNLWALLAKIELDIDKPALSLRSVLKAILLKPAKYEYRLLLIQILNIQSYFYLALQTLRPLCSSPVSCQSNFRLRLTIIYAEILSGIYRKYGDNSLNNVRSSLLEELMNSTLDLDDVDRFRALCYVIQLHLDQKDYTRAFTSYERLKSILSKPTNLTVSDLKEVIQSYHNVGWNLGISLIKRGDFLNGWKLYEHGLQVPAPSIQRWQRALKKAYTSEEVPIWLGESLQGKHLLILAEQAIGDTMMFLQLICLISPPPGNITLYLPQRLVPIYLRTFPQFTVVSHEDLDSLSKYCYDFQIPCGSLPKLLLSQPSIPLHNVPSLAIDKRKYIDFRSKYLQGSRHLIGISWRGGAVQKRVKLKSSSLEFFLPILKCKQYQFVSLQYGDVAAEVNQFNSKYGTDIIVDTTVNPLKDMDTWLSQVSAMDAIVSIANTTVHGAGALKLKTCVLVSDSSDWRWLDHDIINECIWYPSVTIFHQNGTGKWSIDNIKKWLLSTIHSTN